MEGSVASVVCKARKKAPLPWIFQLEDNHLFWVWMNPALGQPQLGWLESPPHTPYLIQWINSVVWAGCVTWFCCHGCTNDRDCTLLGVDSWGTLNFWGSMDSHQLNSTGNTVLILANQWIGYFCVVWWSVSMNLSREFSKKSQCKGISIESLQAELGERQGFLWAHFTMEKDILLFISCWRLWSINGHHPVLVDVAIHPSFSLPRWWTPTPPSTSAQNW